MLVDFRVKNFRSLRDEQVFSLVASLDKTERDTHTLATGTKTTPTLLRSTVIYGANASGKSNLIQGLQIMRERVLAASATEIQRGPFEVQPFRLDANSVNQPTEFEVTFILNRVRYQYGFAATKQRIVSEQLLVHKALKLQHLFKRHFDTSTDHETYEFSANLRGPKNVWQSATGPNALFLSTAVKLGSDAFRPVFDWFANRLVIFNEQYPLSPHISIQMLNQPEEHDKICRVLRAADMSITDIEVNTRKEPDLPADDRMAGTSEIFSGAGEAPPLRFHHGTGKNKVVFEWANESNGTRNLLLLAGPVLNSLGKGLTLIIDELDTSLHTLLVRELVGLFHQPEMNPLGAQLIFTTQDASLLDPPTLFRRDQIWFVDKNSEQASEIASLSEFVPRKLEELKRSYLTGRYAGVRLLTHVFAPKREDESDDSNESKALKT